MTQVRDTHTERVEITVSMPKGSMRVRAAFSCFPAKPPSSPAVELLGRVPLLHVPSFRKVPSKGFVLQMHFRTPSIQRGYYSSSIAMFIWQWMAALSTYLVNSAKYFVLTV